MNGRADAEALLEVLDAEACALRGADYAALEDIAARKEALLADLAAAGTQADADTMRRLRDLSARNAQLYTATLGGLRSVIDRLRHVARATAHLDTYTAGGALRDLGPARPSFEKRS